MKSRAVLKVVALSVIAVVLLVPALGCGGSGPSATVEEFLKAGKDKDCEKMVELIDLNAPEMQGLEINKDELIASCKQDSETSDVVDYKIIKETVDGDSAEVEVEVTISEGGEESTETDTVTLNKRDGEWKIGFGF